MNARVLAPLLALALMCGSTHSTAQTLTWEHTAGPPGGTITALFEAPSGTLLAGTQTAGVFRSADAGETWAPSSDGVTTATVTAFGSVDGYLFAGTSFSGLYRSKYDGLTWVETGYWRAWVTSIVVLAGTLVVGAENERGLLLSRDLGASWVLAESDGHVALDLAVSGDVLYMMGRSTTGARRTLRSRDTGRSWDVVLSRGPALHTAGGAVFATSGAAIMRSDDEGETWRRLGLTASVRDLAVVGDRLYVANHSRGVRYVNRNAETSEVQTPIVTGASVLLAYGSDLLVGTDRQGLWRARGESGEWHPVGLANTDIRGIAAGGGVVYANSDDGRAYRSSDQGASWTRVDGPSASGAVTVVGATGAIVLATAPNRGLLLSDDLGDTWSAIPASDNVTTMLINEDGGILTGNRDGVLLYREGDGTQSLVGLWDEWVHDLERVEGGYIAGASGGVHLSNEDGTRWRTTGLSGLDVQRVHAGRSALWATTKTDMFRSSDGGETWARLPLSAPGRAILDFTGANRYLYAATSDGVFISADLGNSWERANRGFPSTQVKALLAHEGMLYAGTDSVGVYRSVLPAPIATPTVTILSPAPAQTLAEDTTQTEIRVTLPLGSAPWRWRIGTPFAASGPAGGNEGPPNGVAVASGLTAGSHTLFVTLVDASGSVLGADARDSVTFHVAADADAPPPPQRVRHSYDMPLGLSIFSPVLDGDRIRTPGASIDIPAGGGLRASHLAQIGSTVIVGLGEEGFRTAIARDGRIVYGSDFALSGERGYVVNFREPLTFTLEGEPYGTPIISDAVVAAPGSTPVDAWAYVAGVRVEQSSMYPGVLRARVRNVRTGEERTVDLGLDGTAVVALVDAGRAPVVAVGDTLTVDILAPDGRTLGPGSVARVTLESLAVAHSVTVVDVAPARSTLLPNHPNPFNPETWIPFELAEAGEVSLTIYDAIGSRVRVIAVGRREAGYYGANSGAVRWDGRNGQGEPVASGAYIAELRVGASRSVRRLLLSR